MGEEVPGPGPDFQLSRIRIDREVEGQTEEIGSLHSAAFGREQEARLTRRLSEAGAVTLSLLASLEGTPVGHVLFTPVRVAGEKVSAVALGPMAVAPAWQRLGVGSKLVRVAMSRWLAGVQEVVFVVGHSGYYPRFGFQKASDYGFKCEFDVPDDVFMVKELRPGSLAGLAGEVTYHPAFREAL